MTSAVIKWEEKYDLINFDWKTIFSIPFMIARESTLQSFQYQIIHRFFPCNEILNIWYPNQTANCNYCIHVDSIEHYFVDWSVVQLFWKQLFNWLSHAMKTVVNISKLEIIFGIVNENNLNELNVLNFCILFAKYFISKQKKDNHSIEFYSYQIELKSRLEIESIICTQQNKSEYFNEMWKDIIEHL